MIKVNENYIIDIDSYEYTVKRDLHRKKNVKSQTTGEIVEVDDYATVGHYGSLVSAVKGVIANMNRCKLREGVYTLEEAVAIVLENNNKVSELLEKALEV